MKRTPMRLSDFRNLRKIGTFYFAEVCVTHGFWWWKTIETWTIARQIGCNWIFAGTEEFTPGYQAEMLEQNYLMEQQLRTEQDRDTEEFQT